MCNVYAQHTCTNTHTNMHTHTYTRTHIHANTHAHTQVCAAHGMAYASMITPGIALMVFAACTLGLQPW